MAITLLVVASTTAAAPRPLISYFQPMPIVGKLSTTVWGASAVGPRDPANGLEDNGANGGVGPRQQTNFYWDGKIIKGEDGKYHMYASHWPYSNGSAPPAGERKRLAGARSRCRPSATTSWARTCFKAIATPRTRKATTRDTTPTALVAPTGATPYTLSVGEIVPGQMFGSSSANGPWTSLGLTQTNTNGHTGCGTLSSNFTFTVGPDNRFWATSRRGCVMDSDQVLGTYKVETDSVLPNLENNDNGNAEDEVIWYSGGYYHIVYNYWNVQRAYHIMSKDGITNWTSTGLAYQALTIARRTRIRTGSATRTAPSINGTTWSGWASTRRTATSPTSPLPSPTWTRTPPRVNSGGSKILVVPFNGVQFDCDNGDAASCAELERSRGAGGAGSGGAVREASGERPAAAALKEVSREPPEALAGKWT